ncbi:MAG: lytic transglycosylase domain-containing protein [Deltaproteobacteria bacterium]|nr:lytic transglycosylase domain-containing protein [Deltaproteobacteria bacterium]MDQ3300874.1 lytic transglycosylase domain-containing protein [Myxococcota bacterium]
MRSLSSVVLVVCAACSGDNTHQPTTPLVGSGSAQPADAQVAVVPVTPGVPAPLSEAMAVPYFQSGDAGDGARAFALEKWSEALAAFTTARVTAKGNDAHRLDLMLGLTHARLAQWPQAAERLGAALKGLPLLADFLRYQTARALYFAHQTEKANELARQVDRESIHGADAELLAGDILRGGTDHAAIAAHYRDYLARRPSGARRSESRFRLAEALEKSNGDIKEIVELYRRIGIDDPLSSWTTQANARLAALKKTLPPDLQSYDKLTAAEHIARGKELFDAQRNPESEAAFDAALADPAITPADRCVAAYHRAQSRFKARDRKGAAPMFDTAATACKDAKNTDLEIKSQYQAGRSYAFIGQHDIATLRYLAAQVIDPAHSYSDDALLREGEEWTSRGDAKQTEAVLASLPIKFPKGDNVAEAMWRLGWQAWRNKNLDDAIKWWTKQIELVPHDDNYFGEGQAQYWLGRALLAKGKKAEALASWEQGIRQYPAAYYALLGLNRVRETDAKRYATILAEISTDPAGHDPAAPAFAFKPRVEWGSPGFQRALEFLRLGLGGSAEAELRKLGLTAPKDKKRVDDPDLIEKLWAMAFLFDKAGRYGASHWPTRWHIVDYRKAWPIGTNRARWLIGYPKAYEPLLAKHATTNKVPFAMQIAIVREESAFDPLLESYANAVGLTQMIQVTATRFAKGTGIDPTRESLRDPEKNVTIGSRFLGHLFAYWKNFTIFVPPSYNGGEGYVRRNLKTRGTWDADEFIEGILDDQIRNYTKRVMGTFFTYSWLHEQKVPEIPNKIPVDLIPKP